MVLETTTLPIELRAYDRYALKGEGSGTMIIHHGAAVRKQEGAYRDSVWDAQGQPMYLYGALASLASSPTPTLLSYHVRPTFSVFKYIFFCAILSKNDTKKKLSTISIIIVDKYQVRLDWDGFLSEHGPGQPPQGLACFITAIGHAGACIAGRAFP